MNQAARFLKFLMPILSAAYGVAIIYLTALPLSGDHPGFGSELLTWLITLAGIALTLYLVHRVEPKVFPSAGDFSLKLPPFYVLAGLLLVAPLWLVTEEYLVYGISSLFHTVELEPLTYATDELREDLLSSVHAVLLAPILEELCFRQLAISPFRRRRAQVVVCVIMALLFGVLHVRNFPGAFFSAMVYGLVFIWSGSIWCSVALHAGRNLTATLLAVYSWLQLDDMQMAKIPVIILPDIKVVIVSMFLAVAGGYLLMRKKINTCDKFLILTPPVDQSRKRRRICLFLCVLCVGLGWLLNFTYRPYIYAHHINDWHLADTIGNIVAVPAAAFLFYAVQKSIRHTKLAVLAMDFLAWCLYEVFFSMTFDWWDILASLIMCFVTYPILRVIEKTP